MTWGAFLQAMRNGIAQRGAAVTGRRAPQATARAGTRSASTQPTSKQATTQVKEKIPRENWDFMVLDVSAMMLYAASPHGFENELPTC